MIYETLGRSYARLSKTQHMLRLRIKEIQESGTGKEKIFPLRQALMRNRLGENGLRSIHGKIERAYRIMAEEARLEDERTEKPDSSPFKISDKF